MDNRVLHAFLRSSAAAFAQRSFRSDLQSVPVPFVLPSHRRTNRGVEPGDGACRLSDYSSIKKRMRYMRRNEIDPVVLNPARRLVFLNAHARRREARGCD